MTDIGNLFHDSLSYLFIIIYLQNSVIHVLAFLFLSILFLTFIESILENANDVVYLSFISNEGDTYSCYDNENDAIETVIYFYLMDDETIFDQKVIIISNIKPQIIFLNIFWLDIMNTNYVIVPVLIMNTMVSSMETF